MGENGALGGTGRPRRIADEGGISGNRGVETLDVSGDTDRRVVGTAAAIGARNDLEIGRHHRQRLR